MRTPKVPHLRTAPVLVILTTLAIAGSDPVDEGDDIAEEGRARVGLADGPDGVEGFARGFGGGEAVDVRGVVPDVVGDLGGGVEGGGRVEGIGRVGQSREGEEGKEEVGEEHDRGGVKG